MITSPRCLLLSITLQVYSRPAHPFLIVATQDTMDVFSPEATSLLLQVASFAWGSFHFCDTFFLQTPNSVSCLDTRHGCCLLCRMPSDLLFYGLVQPVAEGLCLSVFLSAWRMSRLSRPLPHFPSIRSAAPLAGFAPCTKPGTYRNC